MTASFSSQNIISAANLNFDRTIAPAIAFIDANVDDPALLLNSLQPGIEAIALDPDRDGVWQITTALQTRSHIRTIHIVAHGSPGCLQLGNTHLSLSTIDRYGDQLQQWFRLFHPTDSPTLQLYACNVAAGDAGAEFLDKLHRLTQASIAASAQPVGSTQLGGGWELEHQVGQSTVELPFSVEVRQCYRAVLNITFTDSSNDDDANDLSDSFRRTPTPLGDVGLGENTISGGLAGVFRTTFNSGGLDVYEPSPGDSDSIDNFSFTVPTGFVVSQVELAFTSASFPSRPFTSRWGGTRNSSGGLSAFRFLEGTPTYPNLVAVGGGLLPGVYDYALIISEQRIDPGTAPSDLSYSASYTFKITAVENTTPTGITLSNNSIEENSPGGTPIGDFSTADTYGWGHSYSLVSGAGDAGNSFFTIVGNQLQINAAPDFEIDPSYSIRVRTTDALGAFDDEIFTVNINDVVENTAPTDLALSATTVNENVAANTLVGTFSTTDAEGGSFTYELVSGTGSTDNAAFTLTGNQLKINAVPDFETKPSYNIRVKTTDVGGLSYEEALTIGVNDVNEAPTDLALSATTVNENVAANTVAGTFSTTDAEGGSFTYELVSGTGSTDNAAFTLTGNQLKIHTSPNFEAKSSYNIRVKTTDAGGLSYEEALIVGVNNVNEAPTATGETVSTSKNTAITIELGDNVTDPDLNGLAGATLNVAGTTGGTTSIDQDARLISFTPASNFSGTASFKYIITDAGGLASNEATVIVEVGDILTTGNKSQDIQGNAGNDYISAGNGKDRIQGLGGNDTLLGNNGADTLDGGLGADILTGGNGPDTFVVNSLSESPLRGFDRITDFAMNTDFIDGLTAVSAAALAELGAVASLTESGIAAVLTTGSFAANGAATFGLGTRTFLAINDSTAGFSAATDALIELTGFSGSLTNLAIV